MLGVEGSTAVDFAIRDGMIYCYRRDSTERIRPWGPEAGAWRFPGRASWQAFTPDVRIDLIEALAAGLERTPRLPPRRKRQLEAFRFLLASWPAEAKDCVRPFSAAHWELLQLVNRGGERAVQLLRSNPALGYLVATEAAGDSGRLLGARRREIAARFGFPETEHSVRALGKAPAGCVSADLLKALRGALADDSEAGEVLAQLPRINPGLLSVVCRPELRGLVSFACLRQIGRIDPRTPHFDLVARLENLLEYARRQGRRPPRINRLADIDRLSRPAPAPNTGQQRKTPAPAPAPAPFPPPPLPESRHILAIRTRDDLRAEGRELQHCAARYARRVAEGALFFYRMLEPERATICLRRRGDGWELDAVRGPRNRRVNASTVMLIRNWLRGALHHHSPAATKPAQ
ncbi:MAG: PcfJ domain-containing protein [Acidobacteriota bacterium]